MVIDCGGTEVDRADIALPSRNADLDGRRIRDLGPLNPGNPLPVRPSLVLAVSKLSTGKRTPLETLRADTDSICIRWVPSC